MYSRNYGNNSTPGSNLPPNYHGSMLHTEQKAEEKDCPCHTDGDVCSRDKCDEKPSCDTGKKPVLSEDLILYGLIFLMLTGSGDLKENDHLLLLAVLAYIVLF